MTENIEYIRNKFFCGLCSHAQFRGVLGYTFRFDIDGGGRLYCHGRFERSYDNTFGTLTRDGWIPK